MILPDMPLSEQADRAALKIESIMPTYVHNHCFPVLEGTSVNCPATTLFKDGREHLPRLQQALRQKRKVALTYNSLLEKETINTTICPYQLHFSRRAWYVIGHSSMHDEVRTFKLGRIAAANLLNSRFKKDENFKIQKYFGNAWSMIPEGREYKVKLLFSPMVAATVSEVIWHPTQKLTWNKNESLTFEVTVDGLGEISWWILGYGDQVTVKEPQALRQKIGQMAGRIVKKYAEKE